MAKPSFVARRNDGFGGRLSAILNAMVLSKHCQGEFRFVWPKFPEELSFGHTVSDREHTFSREFVEKFGVENNGSIKPDGIVGPHLNRGDILETAFDDYSCLIVNHTPFFYSLPELHAQIPLHSFRETFDQIKFSPALEDARKHAGRVLMEGDAVAIHLRAGDVIYGPFRKTHGYVQKAIPYPMAELLIERNLGAKNTVIVFGQDDELIEYISEKYPVISANILKREKGFNEVQSALFDIALMGRCEKILAGSSAFAEVASLVSGYQRAELRHMFSYIEINSALDALIGQIGRTDKRISGEQISHALSYAFHFARDIREYKDWLPVLAVMLEHDPGNAYHWMLKAHIHCTLGEYPTAEIALQRHFDAVDNRHELDQMYSQIFGGGMRTIDHYLPVFRESAELGNPNAIRCVSVAENPAAMVWNSGQARRSSVSAEPDFAATVENTHEQTAAKQSRLTDFAGLLQNSVLASSRTGIEPAWRRVAALALKGLQHHHRHPPDNDP